MRSFFSSIFGLFLSPHGLVILSALDSSMLFFLPAAIDTAVVIMSARNRDLFWLFPLLAVLGSLIGTGVTYLIGRTLGEAGLKHWVSPKRLRTVRNKIDSGGSVAMGVAALLPPPFPFTPFVLTSGAIGLSPRKFFASVAIARSIRFSLMSLLAVAYGRQILGWLTSDAVEYVIGVLFLAMLIGTGISIYQVIRRVR